MFSQTQPRTSTDSRKQPPAAAVSRTARADKPCEPHPRLRKEAHSRVGSLLVVRIDNVHDGLSALRIQDAKGDNTSLGSVTLELPEWSIRGGSYDAKLRSSWIRPLEVSSLLRHRVPSLNWNS